jgi:ABC-type transport system involved in cytochrome c biogenesis permease subunit
MPEFCGLKNWIPSIICIDRIVVRSPAYLHARYTLDWKGLRGAILAIIGFIAVLFTYVGVDFLLPQIHGTQT